MARPRAAVPREAPELEMLSAFLDWLRGSILQKLEGLPEEEARRRLVPSKTTLLGLIKHLAYVERWWFQYNFAGSDVDLPRDDLEFIADPGETIEDIIDLYREECEKSRQIVAGVSPDDHAQRAERKQTTLRWIMIHMIEETARHAGHADILREQIDGATGE